VDSRRFDPDPGWLHIAASAGFSDISYFNRAFRARFGATPTDIRASFGDDARFPPAAADDSSAGKKGAAPVAWKRELHAHIAGKRRVRSLG
jgi:AraC-like DNA-binding protein